jgi:hypothetical protein
VVLVQETSKSRKTESTNKTIDSSDGDQTTLRLERADVDREKGVVRMSLIATSESKGIGSGGTQRETRNYLFIPSDGSAGHWLLADNKSRISDASEVLEVPIKEDSRSIASAVIVTPVDAPEEAPGKALLFDPTGSQVTEFSNAVTSIDVTELTKTDVVIIYRNGEKFFRATFDPTTLVKRTESAVQVPKLK